MTGRTDANGYPLIAAVADLVCPSSVLTRPSDTAPYVQNDFIGSNTAAGSVAVPSFQASRETRGGGILIRRARLYTPKTSGMGSFQGLVEFWSAAPTMTNGDNGAYAVATGAASWLGKITMSVMTQVADGGYAVGVPDTGSEIAAVLSATGLIYWTLKEIDATGFTPSSGQTFTLVPEIYHQS